MARARLRRFFRHGFLPQLLAFEAVARLGSVTRAAEELSLAQPTVSCMLRKLSDAVGGPIVLSRDRRMEPTPLGRELLVLCHDMREAMERFEDRHPAVLGYDPDAETNPPTPWPSIFPDAARSRWRQRASLCPRAKRRLPGEGGAS